MIQQDWRPAPTVILVKRIAISFVRAFICALLSLGAANAHAERTFSQAELDSMLAPIALYPDPLLTHILTASIYPFDVKAAADWSEANPNLATDEKLRAVEGELWHPSVKALVAYPDVLARMAESPQWVADLGEAYQHSYPALSATIQQLRSRAQANGNLRSNEQQYVYQQNDAIYVQPVYPNVVYAPYYNPMVVYGTWWWPAVYPVYWRPWVARPVYVTRVVAPVRVWQPAPIHPHHVARPMPHAAPHVIRQPVGQIRPMTPMPTPRVMDSRPYHRVPEAQRAPIVHSGPAVRPAPVQHVRPPQVVHTPTPNRGLGQASQMRGNSGHSNGGGFGQASRMQGAAGSTRGGGGGHGGGHGGGRRG